MNPAPLAEPKPLDLEALRSILSETKLLSRLGAELLTAGKNPHGTLCALRSHAGLVVEIAERHLGELPAEVPAGFLERFSSADRAIIARAFEDGLPDEPEVSNEGQNLKSVAPNSSFARAPKRTANKSLDWQAEGPNITLETRLERMLQAGALTQAQISETFLGASFEYTDTEIQAGLQRLAGQRVLVKSGRCYSVAPEGVGA